MLGPPTESLAAIANIGADEKSGRILATPARDWNLIKSTLDIPNLDKKPKAEDRVRQKAVWGRMAGRLPLLGRLVGAGAFLPARLESCQVPQQLLVVSPEPQTF